MQYNFSFIIPCFNAKTTIKTCLDSIYKNNNTNFEVILVDDGSTDGTYDYVKSIASNYQNLAILRQENKGPSIARNLGIDSSRGDYLLFVDADDYVDANVINQIDLDRGSDGYLLHMMRVTNGVVEDLDSSMDSIFSEINNVYERIQFLAKPIGSSCCLAFKKEVINSKGLRFKEGIFCEDIDFNLNFFSCINSISYISSPYYFYIQNTQTRTSKNNSDKILNSLLYIFDKAYNKGEIFDGIYRSTLSYELLIMIAFSYYASKENKVRLKKLIKKNYQIVKKSNVRKQRLVYRFYRMFGLTITSWFLHFKLR